MHTLRIVTLPGADGDTAHGKSRDHRRARTGRAPPSRTALRSAGADRHVLVSDRYARVAQPRRDAAGSVHGDRAVTLLAPTLEAFFTERLISQRHASPHTISSYRDTLRLLLGFVNHRTGITP